MEKVSYVKYKLASARSIGTTAVQFFALLEKYLDNITSKALRG
jgi:hypothetical protein